MVYPPQLTIQLGKTQLQSIIPDPSGIYDYQVYYAGPNPLSLSQVYGITDTTMIDFTEFVDGLDKLSLTWSCVRGDNGDNETGNFVPKKSASGSLSFERDAYEFIKNWLVNDVAGPLNMISVQITDASCGAYTGYTIKSSDLTWCEYNALCTFELNIKQVDDYYQCVQRTLIADNWQGWFQPNPKDTVSGLYKFHPRFSYCTEHKPNAILVIEWYLLSFLGLVSSILVIIYTIIAIVESLINYIIIYVINPIISAINYVIGFVGGDPHSLTNASTITVLNALEPFDALSGMFVESAGCGREHPAPLIRDYITNVCNKCGVRVDATTADIFFAPIITIQKSDGIVYNEPNPHYNACLFYPSVAKGVRRFTSINVYTGLSMDTTTFYDPNNQPMWALSDMLDALKKPYNAQWRIIANASGVPHLYFKRKDWYANDVPLYDFSINGADRAKLVEGICYQPSDVTKPASMNGLYQDDPADKSGHEAGHWMNGDPLSFAYTSNNPIFFGILDKTSGFGATKFRLDGATDDYIYNAGQVLVNSAVIQPWVYYILSDVFNKVRQYGDHTVLLGGETVSLPKVLIWDGNPDNPTFSIPTNSFATTSGGGYGFLNARAMRDKIAIAGTIYNIGKTAYPGTLTDVGIPDINTRYPSQVPITPAGTYAATLLAEWSQPSTIAELLAWNDPLANPPQTNVIGHSLSFAPPVPGVYTIQDYFGNNISSNVAQLVNWPMYFQPYYKDSLWDWFHWIDDPLRNPKLNKDWYLKIPYCKEDAVKLGLLGDGSGVKLMAAVTLDCPFYPNGVITEMTISFDTGSADGTPGTGQYIELKGMV